MKKLFLLFLILSKSVLLSQTVLNSLPLSLNNPMEEGQALTVEDVKTHNIYVFASDDKKINILKYNKSLFLTHQFTDSIKNSDNRTLSGYSLSEDGNPLLYWNSQDLKTIRTTKYFLKNNTSRVLNFEFPENNEYIISIFQQNNIYYVLAKEKGQKHLLLYEFQNGKCVIKMFDFSPFQFQNEKGQNLTFNSLILSFPFQKMELNDFNPLDKTSGINKMYVLDEKIILTFDHNTKQTQVFELDLQTVEVKERNFAQPVSKKLSRTSNSFYNQNKLFQLKATTDEFLFDIKDFDSGKTIKSMAVSKNDTIRFKNSPLFLQTNNNKPQELKTTSKFLKQLSYLSAGISVFQNQKNNYITFGGFIEYVDFNYYSSGDFFNEPGIIPLNTQSKMAFFDSTFDADFQFVKNKQAEPLAIDNIYYYLSTNKNAALQNILKLKDYYILSYYDTALRQVILRKFTDGFIREDNGNPVMNKLQFSKPFSFGPLRSR